MVLGRIGGWLGIGGGGSSKGGDTKLPDYFPVVPKGCETKSNTLFACIQGQATDRLRAIESAGDVIGNAASSEGGTTSDERGEGGGESVTTSKQSLSKEDPLEPCRDLVAQYRACCDRALKKKNNWILTETYRVQEEYRYSGGGGESSE